MAERKKVLITGAAGFTGQHACEAFLHADFEVVGLSRTASARTLPFRMEICDLNDERSISELIQKIQPHYVLHLAGKNSVQGSWEDPAEYIRSNVMGTVYLLEAIRSVKPFPRTLVVGSALEYNPLLLDKPKHPYAISKTLQIMTAQTWELLFQMPVMMVRPTNLIGPGPSAGVCSVFGKKIAAMEFGTEPSILHVDDLGAKRDFLDVRDAVSAYMAILIKGQPGNVYNLGSGVLTSIKDLVCIFKRLTPIDFTCISREDSSPSVNQEPGLSLQQMLNLGWKPNYSLQQSAADILDYFRGQQRGAE
ncbi:GDP-4-dehydro-6-deoxy-D-mannose reductase [Peribacillus deserti]|uniref:GDP-4-dehydro-6-deoxy-D-mannose reductase n=1 Tax=Peribacillus deserti TaxID=673318 RepID=A0ABS2QJ27_9BACI|nr:NAD-dependent epimerase/dehydratase family protein [Peribacillus deserti]MBM7693015.1 GDP-4-dehydro-6-deoxy-D-mannose reductase [Peribacillus deserti]